MQLGTTTRRTRSKDVQTSLLLLMDMAAHQFNSAHHIYEYMSDAECLSDHTSARSDAHNYLSNYNRTRRIIASEAQLENKETPHITHAPCMHSFRFPPPSWPHYMRAFIQYASNTPAVSHIVQIEATITMQVQLQSLGHTFKVAGLYSVRAS